MCMSASHIVYGSIRMEPVFMMMGEAAGAAASMEIQDNIPVQKINVDALQDTINFNLKK